MSLRLGRFMERIRGLPTTQFVHRKGLDTCDALLSMSHTLQSALESGHEARIVQIDFSASFDRVNHQDILLALLCGYRRFYTVTVSVNRSQHVMVDGCLSKLVDVVSRVPKGNVLSPLLFLLYTSELLLILEN